MKENTVEEGFLEGHEETGEASMVTLACAAMRTSEIKDDAQIPTGVIQWPRAPIQASSDKVGIPDSPHSFSRVNKVMSQSPKGLHRTRSQEVQPAWGLSSMLSVTLLFLQDPLYKSFSCPSLALPMKAWSA